MKKSKNIGMIISIGILFCLFSFGFISLIRYFEELIVQKEIDKLMILANNNMENIQYYFHSKMDSVDMIFDSVEEEARIQALIEQYSSEEEKYIYLPIPSNQKQDAFISSWELVSHDYILNIDKPLKSGVVRLQILLSSVYEEYLANINLGENGYCAMKDENGVIIMHYAESQIGLDSLHGRLNQFPELNPEGVNTLLYNQYHQDSGCDIVNSYWWDRPEEGKVKKIVSYASTYIDGHRFVGTIVMDYNEVVKPLKTFFLFSMLLTVVLLAGFSYLIILWQKEKRNKEKLQIELQYTKNLTQLNEKFEKQELQIQKYDKLQTLGVLSGTVAHEYNNLLTPALIYADLLSDEDLSKEAKEYLQVIHQSLIHCGEFSNQLKDYAKQDVIDEKLECMDLKEVLKANLLFFERIKPSRITLEKVLCAEECWIMGNKRAISQILLNLVNNAFQAIEDEGVVSVKLYLEEKYVCLRVQDNGHGMDASMMDKIYVPFFTTKSENEGTGLGLSVVKKLLKNMHGYIQCESEFLVGTTFIIQIPLVDNYE